MKGMKMCSEKQWEWEKGMEEGHMFSYQCLVLWATRYACKSFQKKSSIFYFLCREPLAVKFACHTTSNITTKSRLFVEVFAVPPQKCDNRLLKIRYFNGHHLFKTPALFCLRLLHLYFKGMTLCSILKFVLRWQLVVLMHSGTKDPINNVWCVFSS